MSDLRKIPVADTLARWFNEENEVEGGNVSEPDEDLANMVNGSHVNSFKDEYNENHFVNIIAGIPTAPKDLKYHQGEDDECKGIPRCGIARAQDKSVEHFYGPKLDSLIKEAVGKCKICCMSKSMQRKYERELLSAPVNAAIECIFDDLTGPLPRSKM